ADSGADLVVQGEEVGRDLGDDRGAGGGGLGPLLVDLGHGRVAAGGPRRSISSSTPSSRSPWRLRSEVTSFCRDSSSRAFDTWPASSRWLSRSILTRTWSTSFSARPSSRSRSARFVS